jgi:hypothetical protein
MSDQSNLPSPEKKEPSAIELIKEQAKNNEAYLKSLNKLLEEQNKTQQELLSKKEKVDSSLEKKKEQSSFIKQKLQDITGITKVKSALNSVKSALGETKTFLSSKSFLESRSNRLERKESIASSRLESTKERLEKSKPIEDLFETFQPSSASDQLLDPVNPSENELLAKGGIIGAAIVWQTEMLLEALGAGGLTGDEEGGLLDGLGLGAAGGGLLSKLGGFLAGPGGAALLGVGMLAGGGVMAARDIGDAASDYEAGDRGFSVLETALIGRRSDVSEETEAADVGFQAGKFGLLAGGTAALGTALTGGGLAAAATAALPVALVAAGIAATAKGVQVAFEEEYDKRAMEMNVETQRILNDEEAGFFDKVGAGATQLWRNFTGSLAGGIRSADDDFNERFNDILSQRAEDDPEFARLQDMLNSDDYKNATDAQKEEMLKQARLTSEYEEVMNQSVDIGASIGSFFDGLWNTMVQADIGARMGQAEAMAMEGFEDVTAAQAEELKNTEAYNEALAAGLDENAALQEAYKQERFQQLLDEGVLTRRELADLSAAEVEALKNSDAYKNALKEGLPDEQAMEKAFEASGMGEPMTKDIFSEIGDFFVNIGDTIGGFVLDTVKEIEDGINSFVDRQKFGVFIADKDFQMLQDLEEAVGKEAFDKLSQRADEIAGLSGLATTGAQDVMFMMNENREAFLDLLEEQGLMDEYRSFIIDESTPTGPTTEAGTFTGSNAADFYGSVRPDVTGNDMIITKDGQVIHTHPDDHLIASKNPISRETDGMTNNIQRGQVGNASNVESLLSRLNANLEQQNKKPSANIVNQTINGMFNAQSLMESIK